MRTRLPHRRHLRGLHRLHRPDARLRQALRRRRGMPQSGSGQSCQAQCDGMCGTIVDTCGVGIQCGSCPQGEYCVNNACTTEAPSSSDGGPTKCGVLSCTAGKVELRDRQRRMRAHRFVHVPEGRNVLRGQWARRHLPTAAPGVQRKRGRGTLLLRVAPMPVAPVTLIAADVEAGCASTGSARAAARPRAAR